jgi:tetratricopeptide (TPR) repeat protein
VVVVNDSPDVLTFPPSFTNDLGVRVERGGMAVPSQVNWERIEVARQDDDPAEVSATTAFTVASQGFARFHGALARTDAATFAPGDYSVLFSLQRSMGAIRDAAGKSWGGHYAEDGMISVRVTEPRTPAEQRRARVAAANAAMLKGDAGGALRYFAEMLRAEPDDLEAQYGSAQAYLDLRRYREAASMFEAVLPRLPKGERTTAYDDAAFTHLALGEDARAEAILVNRYGPDAAKRRLASLRESLRKR